MIPDCTQPVFAFKSIFGLTGSFGVLIRIMISIREEIFGAKTNFLMRKKYGPHNFELRFVSRFHGKFCWAGLISISHFTFLPILEGIHVKKSKFK